MSADEVIWHAADEAATDQLGAILARLLPAGSTVALHGTLGAGKTRLVRAVVTALGVPPDEVLSPTFVLCHEYQGANVKVYHLDAYRIADDDEFLELGPEEFFAAGGLVFIEWGERVERCLPADRLDINITIRGGHARDFHVTAAGETWGHWLAQLQHRLAEPRAEQ